ncbi:pre-mRNA-splicing factor cwc26 [Coccidioides immitis RS]|uniref:Pre-mRNA-splicing factor cwc26 n=1 Tax=Coccidioides immitis (strain RS) TaxID=246410 RepID=J3K6G6_COCIM|nr:pre-mRNA-splicing factor cwc26 [Coccidioides immitis RS]EAS30162.3 pre-mRNA-splicing factor cwc26 [Coccidioides immitis RS]
MSLADYLAKNYLTADSLHGSDRPKKKRKRNKHAEETDGLIIADDDPPDLRSASTTQQKSRRGFGYDDDDDDMGLEATIAASAAAERTARAEEEEDEKPLVVDNDDREDGVLRMESGARAGLQTAAQTAAMVAAQERKHAKDAASMRTRQAKGEEAETIYRDASGRIINVAMKRAEVRKAAEEAAAKEAAEKEALTGDVQRKQKEERRKLMEDAKSMPLARTAEDEELNAELKARERWNDPAAQFLTKPSATSAGAKKMYKGAALPNRYGIRPGHRWDGVDRSNGFEKQWFDARNRRERNEGLAYAWQMDE